MIKWKRTGKEVTAEGTTITYSSQDTPLIIESRRRHIPHSGRAGTWDHTTYCLVDLEKRVAREFYSLADAKEFAEKIQGGETWLIR